jgi:hypothetical protein
MPAVKTIPETYRLRVTAWGKASDRNWCCRVEKGPFAFAATAAEVDAMIAVKLSYAFTDIARTVRAYPWSLTVFENPSEPREPGVVRYDTVDARTLALDVPHLFRVVRKRILDAANRAAATGETDLDYSQVFDARRFSSKPVTVPILGVMQLIHIFQGRNGLYYDYRSPDWRHEWARSLAPFKGMKSTAWAYLRHFLGQRLLNGTDLVRPAGPGELSFRMGSIHGAVICRGDDWSSHT